MRIIKCDRCGKTIEKDIKPWAFAICDSNTGEPYPGNPFSGWDFCQECKDEILEFCRKKQTTTKKALAPIETPESNKPVKPIDKGKMLALRKAGWNLKDIAEDVGCSISTVSKTLSEMKEAEQTK